MFSFIHSFTLSCLLVTHCCVVLWPAVQSNELMWLPLFCGMHFGTRYWLACMVPSSWCYVVFVCFVAVWFSFWIFAIFHYLWTVVLFAMVLLTIINELIKSPGFPQPMLLLLQTRFVLSCSRSHTYHTQHNLAVFYFNWLIDSGCVLVLPTSCYLFSYLFIVANCCCCCCCMYECMFVCLYPRCSLFIVRVVTC